MAWRTSANNQAVTTGAFATFYPQFTCCVWLHKITSGTNNVRIFRKNGITFSVQTGIPMRLFFPWTTGATFAAPAALNPLGVTSHFACSYDSGSVLNLPRMYVDGVEQAVVATTPPTGVVNVAATTGQYILNNTVGFTQGFQGYASDWRLYSRVLSPSEVETIALGRGHDDVRQGLEVQYVMENGVPGAAFTAPIDGSGNGRTGAVVAAGNTFDALPGGFSGRMRTALRAG
ncbi:MAG: LamG domain-containing protein [Deltaproteobacteria bacterium]|nr:LamG domain-containing protein [Deltaproteobacteria bacterium]